MEQVQDNMQKYANYKEQMGRLEKALGEAFYLEAIFIEYAVIEDRMESILRHSEKFNPKKHWNLNGKLRRVEEMQREKQGLVRKYISEKLLQEIDQWKDLRNTLIHALMKQELHTEDLRDAALQGKELTKTLCSKATSYRRALEKDRVSLDA